MKKCVCLVLAVSLILAWGLNSAIGAEKVLKLGASVCLTGRLAKEGNYVKDGYTLWQEEVNKKGGIKVGRQFKGRDRLYDDKSDPNGCE
jgi:branched-chain amino acid transport system substrate-binding protein